MKKNTITFNKTRCYAVLGYSYAGSAFVCCTFDTLSDAEDYVNRQEDGWTYRIEPTFSYVRTLPF